MYNSNNLEADVHNVLSNESSWHIFVDDKELFVGKIEKIIECGRKF